MKMEATGSSETSVYNKPTRRHIPEDDILHSHCRENDKSYKECKYLDFEETSSGQPFPMPYFIQIVSPKSSPNRGTYT
jgi:hypothetical protein